MLGGSPRGFQVGGHHLHDFRVLLGDVVLRREAVPTLTLLPRQRSIDGFVIPVWLVCHNQRKVSSPSKKIRVNGAYSTTEDSSPDYSREKWFSTQQISA